MPTLYQLKPAFQTLLRPAVRGLADIGATANQVTLFAAAISVAAGAAIAALPGEQWVLWMVSPVLVLRMALNAVDGMLARDFGQQSALGLYLNELCDVVSDLALILPFALVAPFGEAGVVTFALMAVLVEIAGILGVVAGTGRNYAGPFGKSDRAAGLGAAAILAAMGAPAPLLATLFPLMAALSLITLINRVRAGLVPSVT